MPSRLDLHNHTWFSSDGVLSPQELLEEAARRGLDCIGVTDHDTLEGGLACRSLAQNDFSLPRVIPGEEISTASGELIGLFLTRAVPAGLTLERTAQEIRAQGGLVYLPHPFDTRRSAVKGKHRERAAELADVIEVRNGRSLRSAYDRRAMAMAVRHGKAFGVGSDAHFAEEVARAWVEVPALPGRDDLLGALEEVSGRSEQRRGYYGVAWVYQIRTGLLKVFRVFRSRFPGA